MNIQVGIISVSDRATEGVYEDAGGPALKDAAVCYGWEVLAEDVVPDEIRDIQRALRMQVNKGCQLILTTGGTGVASRDVTPEAVREMAVRELPGFGPGAAARLLRLAGGLADGDGAQHQCPRRVSVAAAARVRGAGGAGRPPEAGRGRGSRG